MEKSSFRGPGPGKKPKVTKPSLAASNARAAKKSSKRSLKKLTLWVLVSLLVVSLAGGGIYMYTRYQSVKKENDKLASNPQEAVKKEQENLIKAIGDLTELPTGETPTVATVSDASKLQSQTFFVNAQNGDKVLIYSQAKKAYLYRPSTNKIINIAPVNIGNSQDDKLSQ
jgi:hypothetical protein